MRRPTANRDQALIMFLLDTGLPEPDLCSLLVGDVVHKPDKLMFDMVVPGVQGEVSAG